MKRKSRFFLLFVILLSCNPGNKNSEPAKTKVAENSNKKEVVIEEDGGIPIFYNMYLSVEMSSLFKSIGAAYNQKMLNSPDRYSIYNLSTDKAMNLGVFAVDLSYAKYFEQVEQAGKYLKTMHELSTGLGIPEDQYATSLKRIENNVNNKDSLISVANQLYSSSQKYLKENDRQSAAALIIVGGWTEALFIATSLFKSKEDIDLLERIAEQKYSLNDLIDLLKDFSNEKTVREFSALLSDLKLSFANFEVDEKNMANTYKQLNDISAKISDLRKKIVS
jgi:hypothetical protein